MNWIKGKWFSLYHLLQIWTNVNLNTPPPNDNPESVAKVIIIDSNFSDIKQHGPVNSEIILLTYRNVFSYGSKLDGKKIFVDSIKLKLSNICLLIFFL